MKKAILLITLLVSFNSFAAVLYINGPTSPMKYANMNVMRYIVDGENIFIHLSGRTDDDNKNIYCSIKFPISMKEYALELHEKMSKNKRATNFSVTCDSHKAYYANIVVGGENPVGKFSIALNY